MLLSVDSGQLFEVDDLTASVLDAAMHYGDAERVGLMLSAGGLNRAVAREPPPTSVPIRALSLALAQKCNLGCSYCYAQQGSFGGPESIMPNEVAAASVDHLLADAAPGDKFTLAYLGGEPLINRAVLQATTRYAAARAQAAGAKIAFALTTNATLVTAEDCSFFEEYGFTVTISIDGIGATHDRLRPFKSGRPTYQRLIERITPMLARRPRRSKLMARVTVTPSNAGLHETLDGLVALGFDGIAFSPMLAAPTGKHQMGGAELQTMLREMIACGMAFQRHLVNGQTYPFLNVINMLHQIHEGKRNSHPCGAGGGYLGVSSEGGLFACHRFVGNEAGGMGSVAGGVDQVKQRRWIAERNVDQQAPCGGCWARYLCAGGCHYEAMQRGRLACDYIRGWLHYCLGLYGSLANDHPTLLARVVNGPPF